MQTKRLFVLILNRNKGEGTIKLVCLSIFYCQKLQQWGWVTSSHNIGYDPPPTYTNHNLDIQTWLSYINFLFIVINK